MTSITVFCGAHITTNDQAADLVRAITSVKAQTNPASLWLCESHTADTVDHPRLVDRVAAAMPPLSRHLKSRSTKSVWEHYRVLAAKYVEAFPDCLTTDVYGHWVAFVEADDRLAPGRLEAFAGVAQLHRDGWGERGRWAGAVVVEGGNVLVRDVIRLRNDGSRPAGPEATVAYWECCVTARLLHFFTQRAEPAVLRHPWAELAYSGLVWGHRLKTGPRRKLLKNETPADRQAVYVDTNAAPYACYENRHINAAWRMALTWVASTKEEIDVEFLVTVLQQMRGGCGREPERAACVMIAHGLMQDNAEAMAAFRRAPTLDDYYDNYTIS